MFIEEYPAMVPPDLCDRIVAKFESDSRRGPSTVGNTGKTAAGRTGTLLRIGMNTPDWQLLVQPLVPALQAALERYAAKYPALRRVMDQEGLECTFPPLVERVDPGQGFDWHYDHSSLYADRVLACLLYLGDIESGGHTEFSEQKRAIRPAKGKIILFPPYWTHLHRGATPTEGTKYVMSCFWVYPRGQQPRPPQSVGARLAGWALRKLAGDS